MNKETVYILLPVHNRKNISLKFIALLKRQTYTQNRLVLIDDGSVDGTAEAAVKEFPGTVVLKGKGNWWWGGSLHQGYKWLKKQPLRVDDTVMIINDDTVIKDDFIALGITALRGRKKTLLLATACDLHTGALADNGVSYDFKNNRLNKPAGPEDINCLSTRGLFIKAGDFIDLGGFHPVLLPHYASDYEFTIRAHRRGYKLICSGEVKLWFDNATSGIHRISSMKWSEFRKLYFSKRFVENPVYMINYYLLAFPFPYNLKHASIAFGNMLKMLYAVFKFNVKLLIRGN